jgi:hypothetical protein
MVVPIGATPKKGKNKVAQVRATANESKNMVVPIGATPKKGKNMVARTWATLPEGKKVLALLDATAKEGKKVLASLDATLPEQSTGRLLRCARNDEEGARNDVYTPSNPPKSVVRPFNPHCRLKFSIC